MKKQLLIAAVAATMTSAAIADISITGGMKANYKNVDANSVMSNAISHETDLQVTGKSGGTTVYIELNNDSADGIANADSVEGTAAASTGNGNFDVEDVWMKTSIAGATVKAGTWNGSDSLVSADSSRALGKYEISSDFSGVGVKVEGGNAEATTSVTLSGEMSGVSASFKMDDNEADEYKISTTVQGVTVAYHNVDSGYDSTTAGGVNTNNATVMPNTGKSSVMVSGSAAGFDLTYAQANTEINAKINSDSFFGDMAAISRGGMVNGDDVSGFKIATKVAGNAVSARFVSIDATDATLDSDIMTLVATRTLASGVTVEATYTDEDSTTATNDKSSLDLELAVKF